MSKFAGDLIASLREAVESVRGGKGLTRVTLAKGSDQQQGDRNEQGEVAPVDKTSGKGS